MPGIMSQWNKMCRKNKKGQTQRSESSPSKSFKVQSRYGILKDDKRIREDIESVLIRTKTVHIPTAPLCRVLCRINIGFAGVCLVPPSSTAEIDALRLSFAEWDTLSQADFFTIRRQTAFSANPRRVAGLAVCWMLVAYLVKGKVNSAIRRRFALGCVLYKGLAIRLLVECLQCILFLAVC